MTLLPIAERELRVSARNKATLRLRIFFAVGAVSVAGAIGLISMAAGGLLSGQLGIAIFSVLKWAAFVFACAAGIFLTSDCLSEEKREGTMGLLFLTDLRGHDVVLGKLLATSLRTFYSLLAIFPVMALSFVLGGVAADDFWHTLFALCNTLFFSLALGMVVSVISRDSHKAMTGTLAAMVVFLFLIPGLDSLPGWHARVSWFGMLSPVFAFMHTNSYHAPDFWLSTLLVQLAAWCFLALASWLAPKTWHEKGIRRALGMDWQFPLFGAADARARGRSLRDKNPICWIISRDRWASNLARLALLLILAVFALSVVSLSRTPPSVIPASVTTSSSVTNSMSGSATSFSVSIRSASTMTTNRLYQIAGGCAYALSLALEFWLASHVCRFYVEGKRSGFLELLWVTPMQPADILKGHWLALRRLFLVPIAALLLLNVTFGAIQVFAANSGAMALAAAGAPMSRHALEIQQGVAAGLAQISWCVGLFTIVWFSVWMGLTSKRIPLAMLKTFCYVKILPLVGVYFVVALLFLGTMGMLSAGGTGVILWLWLIVPQLLIIAVNCGLIALARAGVQSAFAKWPNSTAS